MPTLMRFGAIKLTMYADDHHPPHFHVGGPDFEVMVRIADLVTFRGEDRRGLANVAIQWAAANRAYLEQRWADLNERE